MEQILLFVSFLLLYKKSIDKTNKAKEGFNQKTDQAKRAVKKLKKENWENFRKEIN